MSDTPQGAGWWQASDDKWYPPESHPDYQAPPPAAPAPMEPPPMAPPTPPGPGLPPMAPPMAPPSGPPTQAFPPTTPLGPPPGAGATGGQSKTWMYIVGAVVGIGAIAAVLFFVLGGDDGESTATGTDTSADSGSDDEGAGTDGTGGDTSDGTDADSGDDGTDATAADDTGDATAADDTDDGGDGGADDDSGASDDGGDGGGAPPAAGVLSVGDSADIGEWVVSVVEFRGDVTDEYTSASFYADSLEPGNAFAEARLRVTYEGDEPGGGDAGFNIYLTYVDANGIKYLDTECGTYPPDHFFNVELVPKGSSAEGIFCLQMPPEALNTGLLNIAQNSSLTGPDTSWWDVVGSGATPPS